MQGLVGKWDGDGYMGTLGVVGEGQFLADSIEGEEDSETLFGSPWGYCTNGGYGMNDPNGA